MPEVTWQDNHREITLHYDVIGQGEPVIFLHGNGNSVKDWHTLGYVDRLASHFQLILIDCRGYGKSSKPHDPDAYRLKSRAADVIAVLDDLRIEQAHVLGASFNASTCFLLAHFFPQRLKSLIFATPYFSLFDDSIKSTLLHGASAFVDKLEELLGCRFDNETVRESFLANDAKAVWASNSGEWFDYCDYISDVNVPSLIYAGSKEPSVNELTRLAEKLPDNQLTIIDGIDHKQAYWQSELTAPVIQNFLTGLSR